MVIIINSVYYSIDDIIQIINRPSYNNSFKNNYYILWNKKIKYLEEYFNDYYKKEKYDFYYYNGLSYNALNIIKHINNLNITYGNTFNRFSNIISLYDLYNPLNMEYGPIVNAISEFIKYNYFYNNKETNIRKVFSLYLNDDDYYYLVARLLFPTYYYDLFKNNYMEKEYSIILNNICNYISYVKRIIIEIKKRHNNMSLLDYVINLL